MEKERREKSWTKIHSSLQGNCYLGDFYFSAKWLFKRMILKVLGTAKSRPQSHPWQNLKLHETEFKQYCKKKLGRPALSNQKYMQSLGGYKQQWPIAFLSLNKFYFFKNNWRKVLAISVQLFHHFPLVLLKTLNDQQGWEMLCCHIVHFKPKNNMISPQASVRFPPTYSKKLLKPHRWLQFHFSWAPPLNPKFIIKKRGTLEILPFSKDCVFDCIDKLCRHPVDPILRSFCWTQLKSLQKWRRITIHHI